MTTLEALSCIVTLTFFGWLFWAGRRRRHRSIKQPIDRPDLPYGIFTRAFDQDIAACHLELALAAGSVRREPSCLAVTRDAAQRRALCEEAYERARKEPAAEAIAQLARACRGYSVCILVDNSGSMAERILPVAGQLKAIAEVFDLAGVEYALFGFTTLGWHGGPARKAWLRAGAQLYPGRLCSLLHVRYKNYDKPLSDDVWDEFVDPSHFFENIDGEALDWADGELARRQNPSKLLIVISDGAPVDDLTLLANGPGILIRHVKQVVDRIESRADVRLGAIGLGHDVSGWYSHSRFVEQPTEFIEAFADLLGDLMVRMEASGS